MRGYDGLALALLKISVASWPTQPSGFMINILEFSLFNQWPNNRRLNNDQVGKVDCL